MQDGIRHMKCECGKEFDSMCYMESKELECPYCGKMIPVDKFDECDFIGCRNRALWYLLDRGLKYCGEHTREINKLREVGE